MIYRTTSGHEFKFNDLVQVTCCLENDTTGRLIQVRKECGQFNSDVFLIRMANQQLKSFENVGLIPYNGPNIPICEYDSDNIEYSILQKYPETGFIIENPRQPPSDSPNFTVTITQYEN